MIEQPHPSSKWLCLVFAGFVLLFGLDHYPLANGQEGQTAEIAREMFLLGEHLIPHFNFVPNLESPPLYYWLSNLIFHVFGVSDFSVRLLPALCTLLLFAGILQACQHLQRWPLGFISVLVLSSSLGVLGIARSAVIEVLFCLCSSLCLLYYLLYRQQGSVGAYAISNIAFALAVLTEGMLALLLITPLLLLAARLYGPPENRGTFVYRLPITLLAAILALSWHVSLALNYPALLSAAWSQDQLFQLWSVTEPATGIVAYPILGLWLFLFPWSLLLFPGLYIALKGHLQLDKFTLFNSLWLAYFLVFFSLVPHKSLYMLISMSVPLAFLLSAPIEVMLARQQKKFLTTLFYLVTATALMLSITFFVLIYRHDNIFSINEHAALVAAVVMLVFAIVGVGFNYCYRQHPMTAMYLNVSLIIPLVMVAIVIAHQMKEYYSEKLLATVVEQFFDSQPLYIYQDSQRFSSLIFYTRQPTNLIVNNDDPQVSQSAYNNVNQRLPLKRFKQLAAVAPVLVTVNNDLQYIEFAQAVDPIRFCQVFRDGQALLLSNQREDCFRLNYAHL